MTSNGASFLSELKRRNVYRVAIAYVIASWLFLQVLDIIVSLAGAPDWIGKLFLGLLLLGLPVVVLLSWAYELTPEGIRLERDVDPGASVTSHTGMRLDKITIVIAIIALSILAIDKLGQREAPEPVANPDIDSAVSIDKPLTADTPDVPSIAVLPFANMSADENSVYFSDGLADTLLHMLAQLREIRVAARTSSFRFRDPNVDIKEIAKALNVGSVLEGSVQKSGNRIRVTAQLIEAESGYHLWSGNFDRNLEDIFAIQDEIATEVVNALKVSLLGDSESRLANRDTDNIEAYTEYLLGIDNLQRNTTKSLEQAELHFSEAARLDPRYVGAWGMLGLTYLRMAEWGSGTPDDLLPRARDAATRAIEIDADASVATSVLGTVESRRGNSAAAEQLLKRAVEIDPNEIVARSHYSSYLFSKGRRAEAEQILVESLAIDPLSARTHLLLSDIYSSDFDFDTALRYLDRLSEIEPLSPVPHGAKSAIEYDRGNWAAAVTQAVAAHRLDPNDPETSLMVAELLIALQLMDAADQWLDHMIESAPTHPSTRVVPLLRALAKGHVSTDDDRLAKEVFEGHVGNRRGLHTLAHNVIWRHAIQEGTIDAALTWYAEYLPDYFEDAPEQHTSFSARIFIADLLRRSGRIDEARRLLAGDIERATDLPANVPAVQMTHLQPLAAAGDREELLRVLRMYARDVYARKESPSSWRIRLAESPLFDLVREDTEFVELIAELTRRAREQRDLLLKESDGSYLPLNQ